MQNESIYVLLADDDEDDRNFFVTAFTELKIKTIVYALKDGVELMEYLAKSDTKLPNIIFLDLNMPRKTGIECLDEIKQIPRLKDISIVIYSTSASEQDIEDSFVRGANVYIKKPSSFNALKNILKEVMSLNWQYHTSGLNRDNFLLSL